MGISIIIPTYNSENYISKCLASVIRQKLKIKKEILIIDGGSKDNTVEIAKKFNCKIFTNKLKTGEAGKSLGLLKSKYKYVLFLDSDNELPNLNWINQILLAINDRDIISAEPVKFCYDKKMGHIDRYCALMGMNDPTNYFIGNYDKHCILSNKWTSLNVKKIITKNYEKVLIDKTSIKLTYGANGTVYKKKYIKNLLKKKYFFDVDVLYHIHKKFKSKYFIAKVNNCINHYYCNNNYFKFFTKQRRRINEFREFNKYRKKKYLFLDIIKFIYPCILIFPIIFQTIKLFVKSKDFSASINHAILSYFTLLIYTYYTIKNYLK